MEEFKHVCKFCSKSFPCGRSLGGHMRSHMVNDISAQTDGTKITKKKLPSLNNNNNGGANNKSPGAETTGYGLRENPKKTWRLADHSSHEDTSVLDKFCRECGKVFQSWKALYGHMKCHSLDKERVCKNSNNSLEEEEQQDSWTSANNSQKQRLVMDSQSDNENAAPNRRKRSKRRIIRYMATGYSSSLSFPNNASSSVSEIEQEQEEIAMCLMMLSRDVGQWGGGFNSVAESSDNNSVFLETNGVSSKLEGKNSVFNGREILKDKKLESEDSKLESRKSEFSATGISRQGIIKSKSLIDDQLGTELSKNLTKEKELDQAEMIPNKFNNSSKRKSQNCFDPELRPDSWLKTNALDSVDCKKSDKSSKFECTTCNKVFHSYQALGGHRASHKKMKGCFASRIDSRENSIETEISPDPTADSNAIKSVKIDIPIGHLPTDCDKKASEASLEAKKIKGHECAICLKVFPTGQALGGHKRSHLVAGTEAKTNQTITTGEPIPAIRDLLDLNLPAPVEEDGNSLVGFNQWWTGSTHKHKALIGLISN